MRNRVIYHLLDFGRDCDRLTVGFAGAYGAMGSRDDDRFQQRRVASNGAIGVVLELLPKRPEVPYPCDAEVKC